MLQPSNVFINSSYLLLNLIYADIASVVAPDEPSSENGTRYYRVGMRLYDENEHLAPVEESADANVALQTLFIILVFALIFMYIHQVDHRLLQQGGDAPGDNAIKDHVKDLYPNLMELAYKDRNFGSRQKLSQCIRNFYQGPDARSN